MNKDSEMFTEETMPIGIQHLNLLHQDHLPEHLLKHLLQMPKGKETGRGERRRKETERGEELFNKM